ncbi:hypothetical protein GALMADRAFT_1086650 [Galerina marginata CBS 339.88]|uniref:Uncharacterized protein n=1 Tax=Galerina marginata (strain CBS 339.88) TaxID=685588 RepID=A0A067S9A5_GALM3|nr:hypothetical protein GALMADRAFT_1086650 [Galerina marginata CBS 339.88]
MTHPTNQLLFLHPEENRLDGMFVREEARKLDRLNYSCPIGEHEALPTAKTRLLASFLWIFCSLSTIFHWLLSNYAIESLSTRTFRLGDLAPPPGSSYEGQDPWKLE